MQTNNLIPFIPGYCFKAGIDIDDSTTGISQDYGIGAGVKGYFEAALTLLAGPIGRFFLFYESLEIGTTL